MCGVGVGVASTPSRRPGVRRPCPPALPSLPEAGSGARAGPLSRGASPRVLGAPPRGALPPHAARGLARREEAGPPRRPGPGGASLPRSLPAWGGLGRGRLAFGGPAPPIEPRPEEADGVHPDCRRLARPLLAAGRAGLRACGEPGARCLGGDPGGSPVPERLTAPRGRGTGTPEASWPALGCLLNPGLERNQNKKRRGGDLLRLLLLAKGCLCSQEGFGTHWLIDGPVGDIF